MLLDFDQNPLQLTLAGTYAPDAVQITALRSQQRNLATVTGNARTRACALRGEGSLFAGHRHPLPGGLHHLPAAVACHHAFQSAHRHRRRANCNVQLRDNQPTQLDLTVRNLDFSDAARSLKVEGVNSELHWTAGLTGPPRPSWLSCGELTGLGHHRRPHPSRVRGAGSRLPAGAAGTAAILRRRTAHQHPFCANTSAVEAMTGTFDAVIEPISMAPIAKAIGLA